MPRQPMILDIPSKPGGVSSLIQGLTQGFMQGTMEQDRENRHARLRRELYRQQLDRENANYQRSRADRVADTADARKYEQGQYATRRADILADLQRKQAMGAQEATAQQDFYEGAGLLPREQAMPDGVAGPGLRPARLPTREGVDAAASRYGAAQGREMTQADRLADNERDAAKFEHKAGTDAEMAAYREKVLAQRDQQFNQTIGLRAKDLAEKERANRARETAPGSYKPSPEQVQKAQNAEKQAAYYAGLAKSWQTNDKARKQMEEQGQTLENLVAQSQLWQMRAAAMLEQPEQAAPTQPAPTRQYPPDVLTEQDRAEYDALLAEQAGGR